MRLRRPLPNNPPDPQRDRWLVSYGDFITLLLAFFVTMYAVTRLDSEKLAQAQLSIRQALHAPVFLGGFPIKSSVGGTPGAGLSGDLPSAFLQALPPSQIEEVAREIEHSLKESKDYKELRILVNRRGVVIHLPEFLFFNSGEGDFRPELYPEVNPLLTRLAEILRKIPNHILIEGHTDNRPIHTPRYPSNWELSTARATALVRYFIERYHLHPARFSAAGYGEYVPLADNATEEGRRLNRRVDLIIQPLKTP